MGTGELDKEQRAHQRLVRLQITERKFLTFVAQRGGEVGFDLRAARPDAAAMVGRLIGLGLLAPSLSPSLRPTVRLTDQGRQIVAQIEIQDRAVPQANHSGH